ncbi:MAG: hypothetical protein AAF928_02765 [Myxococcota bacterium]
MEPHIAFAPGAEDNELAVWATDRIAATVGRVEAARRDFFALRAAVALVAPDERAQVTLRFDHGYLTAHDGIIGVPDTTLCADESVLRSVGDLPFTRRGRLPDLRRHAWRVLSLEILEGDLKVYGLLAHPRLVLRLLRLLGAGGR